MKLYKNFINSMNGLKIALEENSFILELIGGIFLLPYLFFLNASLLLKMLILAVYFLLLAFEILNTSIEKLSDKITKEIDEDIRKIKDLASASVFVVLIILIILITLITLPYSPNKQTGNPNNRTTSLTWVFSPTTRHCASPTSVSRETDRDTCIHAYMHT